MKLPEPVAWLRHDGMKAMSENEKSAWIEAERPEIVEDYDQPLFTESQLRELLSKQKAVMHQAFNALYFSTPIGVKPCKQNADALEALKRALNKEE